MPMFVCLLEGHWISNLADIVTLPEQVPLTQWSKQEIQNMALTLCHI